MDKFDTERGLQFEEKKINKIHGYQSHVRVGSGVDRNSYYKHMGRDSNAKTVGKRRKRLIGGRPTDREHATKKDIGIKTEIARETSPTVASYFYKLEYKIAIISNL